MRGYWAGLWRSGGGLRSSCPKLSKLLAPPGPALPQSAGNRGVPTCQFPAPASCCGRSSAAAWRGWAWEESCVAGLGSLFRDLQWQGCCCALWLSRLYKQVAGAPCWPCSLGRPSGHTASLAPRAGERSGWVKQHLSIFPTGWLDAGAVRGGARRMQNRSGGLLWPARSYPPTTRIRNGVPVSSRGSKTTHTVFLGSGSS